MVLVLKNVRRVIVIDAMDYSFYIKEGEDEDDI